MADPVTAFLATVGTSIGGQVGAALIMYAPQIAAFSIQAAGAAALSSYSSSQRRKAERAARAAYNASLRDRTQTVRGTLEPRQLVLGKVRTGGALAFVGTTGTNKEKLTMVIAIASHRIAGVDAVYFNDAQVTLDGSGNVTSAPYYRTKRVDGVATVTLSAGAGSVTLPHTPIGAVHFVLGDLSGDGGSVSTTATVAGNVASVSGWGTYTGTAQVGYQYDEGTSHARVRWMLGESTQTAFADLVTQFPAQWTSNHRLRGVAYLVVELDYNADAFPTGIPNISAVVRGADEVEDPRTSTTGYTENPALLLRHYLLHPLGGRRVADQLDDDSFIAAANVCDASVNYGSGATAIYKAGTVARTDAVPAQVVDELVEAMAGRWGHSNGRIRVRAGSLAATAAYIDADWLTDEAVSIQPRPTRQDLGNVAQGSFIDGEHDWQVVQFPRVTDSAAVTEDGGELVRELEFGAVTRAGQAQQIAAVMLRDARQALTVQLVCNMRAYPLQVLDVVSVTLDRFGWSSKLFEVVDRAYTHGGGIALTLKETGASIFAFGSSFTALDPEPNTLLPSPWTVPTVGTITASSGTSVLSDGSVVSRCTLSWAAVADQGVTQGGFIEVAYRDAAGENLERIVRAESLTGHTLYALRTGYHYLFKARAVNGAGVRGNWSLLTVHQIEGRRRSQTFRQTAAPSASVAQLGDTWIDTDDGNRLYWFDGTAWQDSRDTGIAAALAAANDAQATADGKIASFWQSSTPSGAAEGDIWFDTDDSNRQYRYNGTTWEVAADTRIGQAVSAAADAQATADGKVTTFIQSGAPTAEAIGDLWVESDAGNLVYRWNGSAWISLAFGAGAVEPEAFTSVAAQTFTSVTSGSLAYPDPVVSAKVIATLTFSASVLNGSTQYGHLVLNMQQGSAPIGNSGRRFHSTTALGGTVAFSGSWVLSMEFDVAAGAGAGTIYWAQGFQGVTPGGPSIDTGSDYGATLRLEVIKR